MKGIVEYNVDDWRLMAGNRAVYATERREGYFDVNQVDDIWNFDNARSCPWIAFYYPEPGLVEISGLGYGHFVVMHNEAAPYTSPDYAPSHSTKDRTYSESQYPPEHSEYAGINAFNIFHQDINFYTPAYKAQLLSQIGQGDSLMLGSSLILNNIPIFEPDEHGLIDFTNPDMYKGCAYKNGRFYQEPLDLDNPYEDNPSEDDGGPGTNDWDSDPIPELDLPPDYFGDSGLISIWTPTTAELRALGNYLWSDNGLDVAQLKKIVNNPFDLVLGLNWIPLHVTVAGQKPLSVGNILGLDSGLTMSYPTQENYRFDFGSISTGLEDESKSFVSYAPYTRMSISIPFIGKQAIDADLIRKSLPVNLKMKYNIVTGTICAYLYGKNQTLLYQWEGSVPSTIPVAQNDHTQSIAGMMGLVAGAVGGAVTGAVVGGGAAGAVVGGLAGTIQGAAQADLKPTVTTTGSYSGNGSSLNGTGYAYIEVMQANLSVDDKHRHYLGLPRNVSGKIKSNYGYNSVKAVRVDSKRATDSERDEIRQLLENGYIYGDIDTKSATPKPAVIADESLQLMLYQNSSSNSRIDKSVSHLHTYSSLTLKEPTSIQSPTIRLSAGDTNVVKGNYAYIPKFDRFYYVTDVRSLPGGLWELDLKCDVLMSFREEIIDNVVLFNHSEGAYNLYLNDGTLQVDSRPRVKLKRFPNALDVNGTYVLIMAGGLNT